MKKKIFIILIVIVGLIFGTIIYTGIKMTNEMFIEMDDMEDLSSEIIEEGIIKGKGTLTSFNIEELDTGFWTKIDEVFVKNEDMVSANQKILTVSNEEAKGTIYSTISGKFYIEENGVKNNYSIYDLDNVGLEIEVSEEDGGKLEIGQKAKVSFNSQSEDVDGNVCYISKIPVDGMMKVKIKIKYDSNLKLGYTGTVKILLNEPRDENISEFDIKNSFKKIGKTEIKLKESGGENQATVSINDILASMYGQDFDLGSLDEMELDEDQYSLGMDIDELSEYYSDMWNEYWNNYWKTYYEEYQTFQVIEPTGDMFFDLEDDIDMEN